MGIPKFAAHPGEIRPSPQTSKFGDGPQIGRNRNPAHPPNRPGCSESGLPSVGDGNSDVRRPNEGDIATSGADQRGEASPHATDEENSPIDEKDVERVMISDDSPGVCGEDLPDQETSELEQDVDRLSAMRKEDNASGRDAECANLATEDEAESGRDPSSPLSGSSSMNLTYGEGGTTDMADGVLIILRN